MSFIPRIPIFRAFNDLLSAPAGNDVRELSGNEAFPTLPLHRFLEVDQLEIRRFMFQRTSGVGGDSTRTSLSPHLATNWTEIWSRNRDLVAASAAQQAVPRDHDALVYSIGFAVSTSGFSRATYGRWNTGGDSQVLALWDGDTLTSAFNADGPVAQLPTPWWFPPFILSNPGPNDEEGSLGVVTTAQLTYNLTMDVASAPRGVLPVLG